MTKQRMCKNCGHRIRSLTIYDRERPKWKHGDNLFTHSKHSEHFDIYRNCRVKGCWCEVPEMIE